MTKRNDIALAPDDALADECRESARLIALEFANTMQYLSDSSLDSSYALSSLMMTLTRIAYNDDETTDTHLAFDKFADSEFIDDLYFASHLDLPIIKYFS